MIGTNTFDIIKPINFDNDQNACWINAPLFAASAHEIIIFQHFILDNSRLTPGELDIIKIFIDIFLNINRLNNLEWNGNTYYRIYEILSDKKYGNYFYNNTEKITNYGYYGDGAMLLQKFMGMINKNYQASAGELCYLHTETRVCRNKAEFDSLKEMNTEYGNFELISFIASVCTNSTDISGLFQAPGHEAASWGKKQIKKKRDVTHFRGFTKTNNGKWRFFDAPPPPSKGKTVDINYDEIFKCSHGNGMHMCCIYVNRVKYNNIIKMSKYYDNLDKLIKFFNTSKKKTYIDIMEFYNSSNNFIDTFYSRRQSQIKPKSKSQDIKHSPVLSNTPTVLYEGSQGSRGSQGFYASQVYNASQASRISEENLNFATGSKSKSKKSSISESFDPDELMREKAREQGSEYTNVSFDPSEPLLPDSGSIKSKKLKKSSISESFDPDELIRWQTGREQGSEYTNVSFDPSEPLLPDSGSIKLKKSSDNKGLNIGSKGKYQAPKKNQKSLDILKKGNINLFKKDDIRKYLNELNIDIPKGTIDIRGLLIESIIKLGT